MLFTTKIIEALQNNAHVNEKSWEHSIWPSKLGCIPTSLNQNRRNNENVYSLKIKETNKHKFLNIISYQNHRNILYRVDYIQQSHDDQYISRILLNYIR